MTTPTHYQIKVKGQLDPHWSDWFDGLTISHETDGNTILPGSDHMSLALKQEHAQQTSTAILDVVEAVRTDEPLAQK